MSDLTDLRTAPPALLDAALALNAGVEEMTSPLSPARLAQLVGWSCAAPAMCAGDRLDGFLIGFDRNAAYDSPNFLWFRNRLDSFYYIDRVVVAPTARGRGIGARLYAAFEASARAAGAPTLVCEVNLDPPNPGSDAFHAALGFAEIGRGTPSPGKVVRYLARPASGL